jgi:1,4-dihydroxy-2-naphthoyl-CoA hydrolase
MEVEMSGSRTERETNGCAARPGPLDTRGLTAEGLNARSRTTLPGLLGVEIVEVRPGVIESRLDVRPDLLAPNGFLHGGTVVALADTACGYGCAANLPEGGIGFATVELKTNFFGTALDGGIACRASLVHGGRTTQVWDAEVTAEATGAVIALFRCTQMVLYPRA